MLNAYLKGLAAVSTAGILLFGAGSAARAELGTPPSAPGVDSSQAQNQALAPSDYTPASQMQSPQSREYGSPAPQRHPNSSPATRHSTPQDTTGFTPAPPSSATANVIDARIIDTCVSCTSAGAGSNSARARATAIRLLGNNIQGGEGTGTSKNSGALIALPANPLLYLAVADWEESTAAGATSTSHSRAALVDLVIGPDQHSTAGNHRDALGGAISVAVLEATSDAGYQGLSSTGQGSNNGVDVNIGNGALVIILLHSDASSANKGSAYVLGINGTQILSSDQTGGGGVPIAVPGVVGLVLLQVGAAGGNGATGGAQGSGAAVGTVSDLLGQSGMQAGVLTASAVGLTGLAATPNAGTPPATGTPAAAAAAAGGLKAPNTGAAFGLGGLLLLLGGGSLLFATLRRRNAA
jgi:hypothetical protein